MGGLGNQLFQLCALISYSIDHNLTFGIRRVSGSSSPFRIRNVYWTDFLQSLSPFLYDTISYPIGYEEPHFHYAKMPEKIADNTLIHGYFQSYRYFDHNFNAIDGLLNISTQRQNLGTDQNMNNSISIHFRIGDYAKLQQQHPVLSINYYINALNHICKETGNNQWTVVYYYEHCDWTTVDNNILQLRAIFPNMTFISCDHTLPDWQQMLHMSLCQHNIIANSTFSWWAAYLNMKVGTGQIVCYPTDWFGIKLTSDTKDLFFDTWIPIAQ
jgi:hypothetical protein